MAAVSFLLASCAGTDVETHDGQEVAEDQAGSGKLRRGANVYVAQPADRVTAKSTNPNSGRATAAAIANELKPFAGRVMRGTSVQMLDVALHDAQQNGAEYLIYPSIIRWDDKRTDWGANRSAVQVQLSVYESVSGKQVDAMLLQGTGKVFGDEVSPESLLKDPLQRYYKSVY